MTIRNEEQLDKMMRDSTEVGRKLCLLLMSESKGRGHLVITATAFLLAMIENAKKGSLDDIVAGGRLISTQMKTDDMLNEIVNKHRSMH